MTMFDLAMRYPRYVLLNKKSNQWGPKPDKFKEAVFTGHYAIAAGRYSAADGCMSRVTEFEYCSKSYANVYMAMWRHLSAGTVALEHA